MKKIIGVCLLCFVLSGCSSKSFMNTENDPDAVRAQQKALVIMKTMAVAPNGDRVASSIHWKKVGGNKYFLADQNADFLCFSFETDDFQAYTVEPGVYELNRVEFLDKGSFLRSGAKYHSFDLSNIASFRAHPGEIIYVGNLVVSAQKSRLISRAISIEDEIEEARNFIAYKYPEYSKLLKQRLIALSKKTQLIQKAHKFYGIMEKGFKT